MSYVLNSVITGIANTLNNIASTQPSLIDNYIVVNYIYTSSKIFTLRKTFVLENVYYMNQKNFRNQTAFLTYVYGIPAVDGTVQQYTNRAILSAQNL